MKYIRLLALVAGLVGGGVVAGDPPAPSRNLDPAGVIAFVNDRGQLAVVDPQTNEVVKYGGNRQQAIFPTWSSSGSWLAVVIASPNGSRVELVDVTSDAEPTVIFASPDRAPIYLNWSPDDTYLAVLSSTPIQELALDIVDVTKTIANEPDGRVNLVSGQPLYWVWSDTGRSLLVHVDVLRPSALVGLSDIDVFAIERPLPGPGAFQAPDISDSGEYLAYASHDDSGSRVVVVANPEHGGDGGAVVQLEHEGMVAFAWRPDHDELSVQGATTAGRFTGPVELLDVPSGETRVLTDAAVLASFWSPDGRWLATLSGDDDAGQIAGVGIRHIQSRPAALLNLEFIEVDTHARIPAGVFRPTPAFLSQYLPFFDQYARSHSLWAPDSTALVLPTIRPDGTAQLVIFRPDGGNSELVDGDMPAWNVR